MTQQAQIRRTPLSRPRVLQAAVALADRAGLEAFSMRGLAQELGVVPMALYKHVANKDELLDGMVDIVFGEIDLAARDLEWQLRDAEPRALNARGAEAPQLGDRDDGVAAPGAGQPAKPRRGDGLLREAGFSFELALHAYSVQDAYIYGFALQERDLGFASAESAGEAAQKRAATIGALDDYPYLAEVVTRLPATGYDNAIEFAWGLDLILDGLELRRRNA